MGVIRNIFISLMGFWLISMFFISSVFACTPGACLVNGHKQDTLFLGEVISEKKDNLFKVKVFYPFSQNKLSEIKKESEITVSDFRVFNLSKEEKDSISFGNRYLFSLNKNDNNYYSAWGIYEVVGDCISGLGLKKMDSFDADVINAVIKSAVLKSCLTQVGSKT